MWIPTDTGTDVFSTRSRDVVANVPFDLGLATPDAANDTLVVTGPAQSIDLWVYPVAYGTTPVAPYESVPVIGSALPWFVGGALALWGAGVLLAQYHRRSVDRRKARWRELEAQYNGLRPPNG